MLDCVLDPCWCSTSSVRPGDDTAVPTNQLSLITIRCTLEHPTAVLPIIIDLITIIPEDTYCTPSIFSVADIVLFQSLFYKSQFLHDLSATFYQIEQHRPSIPLLIDQELDLTPQTAYEAHFDYVTNHGPGIQAQGPQQSRFEAGRETRGGSRGC